MVLSQQLKACFIYQSARCIYYAAGSLGLNSELT